MNPHYTYLLVDVGAVLVPFLFSFGPKIAFYKQWRFLIRPMIMTAIVFIGWDVVFTRAGIWDFNERYTLPFRLLSLPLEEWAFFFAIPYSCVFVYTSLNAFFPLKAAPGKAWRFILPFAAALVFIAALNYSKAYTAAAFGGCGIGLMMAFLLRRSNSLFNAGRFLFSYAVCLVPFFVVNGILTALPVVIYNDNKNLGVRIFTIPVEDIFYGMLLLLGSIWGLERSKLFRHNKRGDVKK